MSQTGHTAEEDAFLRALGARMRLLRQQRGMTRRALSARSGVSERYIAQFEGGEGNASALVLHRIGAALGVALGDLFAMDVSIERALLGKLLARLDEPTLAAARKQLGAWLGQPGRGRRIALIGLRGAGKSTLGRMLAERRGVPFVELDREVERHARMDLRDLFEVHGQDGFRRAERETLERLLGTDPSMVIAPGGGIVTEAGTYELLLARCLTVWVRASPEEHMARVVTQGDRRPMADNAQAMDDLRAILHAREALYAKADAVLDTSGRTLGESIADLESLVERAQQDR